MADEHHERLGLSGTPPVSRMSARAVAGDDRTEWGTEDVCAWLQQLSVPRSLIDTFRENGVQGSDLATLSVKQLHDDLGVSSFLAKKILKHFSDDLPIPTTGSLKVGLLFKDRYEVLRALGPRTWRVADSKDNNEEAILQFHKVSGFAEKHLIACLTQLKGERHPNLVSLLDFGMHEDLVFSVSEYVRGESLEDRMRRGCLSVKEVVSVTEAVLDACNHAHELGVVHGNLKPGKIMMTHKGVPKVGGWGETPVQQEGGGELLPFASKVSISSTYTSPEQLRGQIDDIRSDFWSLGTIMFLALTGRHPFLGNSMLDVIVNILTDDPLMLVSECDVPVPQTLNHFVLKCFEREAGERFQTAQSALDALAEVDLMEEQPSQDFDEDPAVEPEALRSQVSFRYGNLQVPSMVFALGGRQSISNELATVERFSEDSGYWEVAPPMTTTRCHLAATMYEGAMYALGGFCRTSLASVEFLNFRHARWELTEPMLHPRGGLAVAVLNGMLYALGGHDSTTGGVEFLDSVEKFDGADWDSSLPMPSKRCHHAAVTLKDRIYCIGGSDTIVSFLNSMDIFDLEGGGRWVSGARLQYKRCHHAAAVVNDRIYVVGGDDERASLASVERYDEREGKWSEAPPLSARRGGLSICEVNNRLYAIGGRDDSCSQVVEIFDETAGKWIIGPALSTPRFGLAVVAEFA